jgi:hypothetical protein
VIAYFTDVDHHGHEPWSASTRPAAPSSGARTTSAFSETDGDAELSAEVIDEWQRRGWSPRSLLHSPTGSAGKGCDASIVSDENRPVIDMLERAGATRCEVAGERAYAISIPDVGTPDRLREVMRGPAASIHQKR